MRGLGMSSQDAIKGMAKDLIKLGTDLGDERAVLRDLQHAKWAYSLIILFSDQAVEEARTLLVTG